MSRRGRASASSVAIPPLAGLLGWVRLDEPLHAAGLAALGGLGLILGAMMPAILASVRDMPKLIVPNRTRIWWRRGAPREEQRSNYIPTRLRRAIYAADRYRCMYCGQAGTIHVDHIRPWIGGGLAVMWNLAVLCEEHNLLKSNCWRERDGYVFYHPGFSDPKKVREALDILAYEKLHRWSPGRWIRAGLALAA